jgi:hypothetical protein
MGLKVFPGAACGGLWGLGMNPEVAGGVAGIAVIRVLVTGIRRPAAC